MPTPELHGSGFCHPSTPFRRAHEGSKTALVLYCKVHSAKLGVKMNIELLIERTATVPNQANLYRRGTLAGAR